MGTMTETYYVLHFRGPIAWTRVEFRDGKLVDTHHEVDEEYRKLVQRHGGKHSRGWRA